MNLIQLYAKREPVNKDFPERSQLGMLLCLLCLLCLFFWIGILSLLAALILFVLANLLVVAISRLFFGINITKICVKSFAANCGACKCALSLRGRLKLTRSGGCLYSNLLLYLQSQSEPGAVTQNQWDASSATTRTEPKSAVCTLCTQMACYLLCLKCESKNIVCCQVKCICCNV